MGNSKFNVSNASRLFFCPTFYNYRIYSINRPERLLNFWTLRVGAYSRLGAYSNKYGKGLKTWFELSRLKLYRNDLRGNKNYFE